MKENKNGDGKGNEYLEGGGEEERRRKGRKIFGEGKYLVSRGEEKQNRKRRKIIGQRRKKEMKEKKKKEKEILARGGRVGWTSNKGCRGYKKFPQTHSRVNLRQTASLLLKL